MTDSAAPVGAAAPTFVRDPTITRGIAARALHPVARLPEEWKAVMSELGEKPFRARQVFRWIHTRGVLDAEQMTDLSRSMRQTMREDGLVEPGEVTTVHESVDGTRKVLLTLAHGAKIETVLIPMTPGGLDADLDPDPDPDDEAELDLPKKRITLCISTQFGCAMGCVFCASGQAGLFRGLGAAEVVYQVLVARRFLRPDEDIRNLVFMGMGEPLHHYEETERALRLLTHPEGDGMSPRRITVSTVGLVPGIKRLGQDFGGKIGLALSLHAADDETRSRIMPMNKRYPIAELIKALRDYPLPPRRRLTIEYTLIGGVNDSLAHADRLAKVLRPLRVKINLIPMNGISASELKGPGATQIVQFRERLVAEGYSCFVRTRRGDDVSAACGQLALQAVAPERLIRRSKETS